MEKQRIICFQQYAREPRPCDREDFWPCRCVHCSDGREAELNPIKCIPSSCMEPIPCDSRASQPCPQCGACNNSRLVLAQKESAEFNAKLVRMYDIRAARNHCVVHDEKKGLHALDCQNDRLNLEDAFALAEDTEASKLLHPDSMVKNVLWYRISQELDEQKNVQEAWKYRGNCLAFVKNYYSSFSVVDPCYGEFLAISAWMAQRAECPGGHCKEACKTLGCCEPARCQKMDFKGKTIVNFNNVEWSANLTERILARLEDIANLHNTTGEVAYRLPAFLD